MTSPNPAGEQRAPRLSEAQITRAVMEQWRVRGAAGSLVAAPPNMGSMGQYGLTPGIPDLLVIAKGLPVGLLELKTETGKLSESQEHVRAICLAAGVWHHVAYGLDEAITILEIWGALKPQARAA